MRPAPPPSIGDEHSDMGVEGMDEMRWTYNPTQHVYSATAGLYHCRVWRHLNDTWIAMVIHQTTTTVQEDFPTPADAQAWCELQMAGSPPRT